MDVRLSSWVVHLDCTPDQAVWVEILAWDIVLCSWARHFTLSASVHPGIQMGTDEFNTRGNLVIYKHPIQGGVEMPLVASCYGNRDKLRPDGPLGSCADFLLENKVISNLLRLV